MSEFCFFKSVGGLTLDWVSKSTGENIHRIHRIIKVDRFIFNGGLQSVLGYKYQNHKALKLIRVLKNKLLIYVVSCNSLGYA